MGVGKNSTSIHTIDKERSMRANYIVQTTWSHQYIARLFQVLDDSYHSYHVLQHFLTLKCTFKKNLQLKNRIYSLYERISWIRIHEIRNIYVFTCAFWIFHGKKLIQQDQYTNVIFMAMLNSPPLIIEWAIPP